MALTPSPNARPVQKQFLDSNFFIKAPCLVSKKRFSQIDLFFCNSFIKVKPYLSMFLLTVLCKHR